ncbi:hypothetical protein CR513_25774, partial [Mucuna pruriens]
MVERYKARLVMLGNRQVDDLDYNETFALVAKMAIVQTLLVVVAIKNWELHQIDVHNAFLHGDLNKDVYMHLLLAPRFWFSKLAAALKKYGFVQSYSDYSLLTYLTNGVQLNMLIYVDMTWS